MSREALARALAHSTNCALNTTRHDQRLRVGRAHSGRKEVLDKGQAKTLPREEQALAGLPRGLSLGICPGPWHWGTEWLPGLGPCEALTLSLPQPQGGNSHPSTQ